MEVGIQWDDLSVEFKVHENATFSSLRKKRGYLKQCHL